MARINPLTNRQREIYNALCCFYVEHGLPPTVRELGSICSIKSTNCMWEHLQALVKKGYLKRRARTRGYMPSLGSVCPMCQGSGEAGGTQ